MIREDTKGKKSKSGLLIALMVSGLFASVLLVSNFQDAHATAAIVGSHSTSCGGVANCSGTLSVSTGNLIVVLIYYGATFTISSIRPTDSIGNTFFQAVSNPYKPGPGQCGNLPTGSINDEIWYATSSGSNAADVVTTHLTGSANCAFNITVLSFNGTSGFVRTGTALGFCSQSCTNSLSTLNSASLPANYLAISGAYGAPFINMVDSCGFGQFGSGAVSSNGWCYSVPGIGSPSNPTSFPMSGLNNGLNTNWGEVGVVFGIPATTTSSTSSGGGPIVVIGCTWYQEQCWLFPVMFLGLFSVIWIGIAAASKVSTRGMTYILMSAMTYGTVIEIMMGMLPSEILILMIVADVVYAIGFSVLF